MPERSEHQRITDAGWSYRTNERGWIIYLCPTTGLWRTRSEALAILDSPSVVAQVKVRHAHQSE